MPLVDDDRVPEEGLGEEGLFAENSLVGRQVHVIAPRGHLRIPQHAPPLRQRPRHLHVRQRPFRSLVRSSIRRLVR